jgi:hypothetical protein
MATPTFSFSKGSSLTITGVYTQSSPEAPANLDGVDLYCTFRDSRGYEYPITVTQVDSVTFTMLVPNTQEWHWGLGFMDMVFVKNGLAIYSEVINANCLNSVTKNIYT